MGRIHTPHSGRTSINVELIHMQALLAFLQDALIAQLYEYYHSDEEGGSRVIIIYICSYQQFNSKLLEFVTNLWRNIKRYIWMLMALTTKLNIFFVYLFIFQAAKISIFRVLSVRSAKSSLSCVSSLVGGTKNPGPVVNVLFLPSYLSLRLQ